MQFLVLCMRAERCKLFEEVLVCITNMTDCHIIEEASFCLFISPGIYIDQIFSAVLLAGIDCSLLRKNANNNYTGVNAQTLMQIS